MEPLTYLQLQMRLEGKEIVSGCFIRQIEIIPDEELPLMLIAQLANEELVAYYAETISHQLQVQLAGCAIHFPIVDPLLKLLKSKSILFEVGHYKTYVFASQPRRDIEVIRVSRQDHKVKDFGFDEFAEEVFAIEQNGLLVSACVSARENEKCGEAWVFTAPEHRHQGFAQKVVNAWARNLIERGKIPFYSHKIQNIASANLAKKLRLQPVFEEISITQV